MLVDTRVFPPEYMRDMNNTLNYWKELIETNGNYSFTKFGDGELICMANTRRDANCDGHPYTSELAQKLNEAFDFYATSDIPNIFIGEWADQPGSNIGHGSMPRRNPENGIHQQLDGYLKRYSHINFKFVNFEIMLQNTISLEKYELFKALKTTNRHKVFVGPEQLNGVQKFLNANTHIKVPLINAFGNYARILHECKMNLLHNAIFFFSSGMQSKSLIADLLKTNRHITCIDVGSGFDPIFLGTTREGQPHIDTLRRIWAELL